MIEKKFIEPYKGEPDIERLLAAFRREPVDRVPNLEILIEDKHVEKFLGKYAGNTMAFGGDPSKGVVDHDTMRPMYPDDYIDLCNIIGQDAMIFDGWDWTPFKRKDNTGKLIQVSDRSVKKRKDFEALIIDSDAQAINAVKYIKEYREAIKRRNSKLGISCNYACILQTLYEFVVGMNDFMIMVLDDRGLVEDMLEVSTEHTVKVTKAMVKAGVDFLFPNDDVAFNGGLFIPPKIFKEMWIPKMARIIEPAVNAGIPVFFHSDGKIDDIVEDLIEMGVDCLNPMDPSSVNYRDYKKRFGSKLCLSGNVDIGFPLVNGTPEEIDRDVKEHMDILKPGYGYVASCSHSIVNYIPHNNVITYYNAIHRYGKY
jgi:uroporphyrinogen-III decarboxylase